MLESGTLFGRAICADRATVDTRHGAAASATQATAGYVTGNAATVIAHVFEQTECDMRRRCTLQRLEVGALRYRLKPDNGEQPNGENNHRYE